MKINQEKIWSEMPQGAKVVGGIAAVAPIGASLVASVLLAGAALFAALVMMVYGAVVGKRRAKKEVMTSLPVVRTLS